jgi:hypothetical protein
MKKLILVALTAIITIGATGCVVTARPRPVVCTSRVRASSWCAET